ncbi:MAG TPA: glycosyltransferase family 4 protein [Acidobacteriota bacterium]|nr:glycosyltransferase family 4 protein [Acidobacteriota bacterium]
MPHRIRVVRIFSRLNIGGPSIHVILLTARLDAARFETTLMVGQESPGEGNMADLALRCGVTPIKIPSLGREISPWSDLWTIYVLWRYLRRMRPHIVHTHTSKAGFSGRIAAWLAGVPVVVHTFHGHVFEGYFGPLLSKFFIALERILALRSNRIIAISESLRRDLAGRRIAPREKLEVVALGLDLDPFLAVEGRSGVLRAKMRISDDAPLIGIIGRLVPIKDHATFLEAAARAIMTRRDMKFAVIGDGELRSSLEARARALRLDEKVYFAGWEKDLAPIYADLNLVVLSSRNEGTPVSIIEGSAAGRPVVATCVGGVPDMIQDGWNGLLVPPGDPEALASAMIRVIENPAMAATFAQRSRKKFSEIYSVARLVSDVELLYIRLLGAKGISVQGKSQSADSVTVL